jgi:DNA repair protein RadA/Sms
MNLAQKNIDVLYVSAEESAEQIKLRATRINPKFSSENFHLVSLSDVDGIVTLIQQHKPGVVIIDSIQTVQTGNIDSFAGSVGQIRYAAASFIKLAKSLGIPTIMVGHVTKEGMVAGPMLLSHMVDTVLFF